MGGMGEYSRPCVAGTRKHGQEYLPMPPIPQAQAHSEKLNWYYLAAGGGRLAPPRLLCLRHVALGLGPRAFRPRAAGGDVLPHRLALLVAPRTVLALLLFRTGHRDHPSASH